MALIHAHFFSPVLDKQVAMNVLLPDSGNGPFPVFYLLHGLSDDHTTWQRRTSIERYAQRFPFIIAMPDGFRSFYTDHVEGPAYGRYFIEDVLGFVERTFPARREQHGRCIGGLSMGGYGALRLALSHPRLFASATSHSGALQAGRGAREFDRQPEFLRAFGPNPAGSTHDLQALALRLKQSGESFPALRIDCGTEDFLLDHNRIYAAFLQQEAIPHDYVEFPGAHTWDYWDARVQEALEFHTRALKA